MTASSVRLPRPDYGLDAPGVVRNLFLVGLAGFAVTAAVLLGVLPEVLRFGPVGLNIFGTSQGIGFAFVFTAVSMVYSSRYGKLKRRERLLDQLSWTGGEQVLDVGCGRGLLLVAAARRLTTGSAVGVDIWRSEDLSGNKPEATLANAAAEGVADRVRVETGDMRQLPFPDASFDRVVSSYAIHNIEEKDGRQKAIEEISRVLRPGASAMIDDIRHYEEYRQVFARQGVELVRRIDNPLGSIFWMVVSFGSLRPGTMVVRKG